MNINGTLSKILEKIEIEDKTFKNGDIIVSEFGNIAIFSHTKKDNNGQDVVYYHCLHFIKTIRTLKVYVDCGIGYAKNCRLATKYERELMIKIVKENGYEWNSKTKTLKRLVVPKFKVGDRIIRKNNLYNTPSIKIKAVTKNKYILENKRFFYISCADEEYILEEKFDPKTLKPFDKVLVRNNFCNDWCAAFFSYINNLNSYCFRFVTTADNSYKQMIPYNEETKHLLGTNKQAPEFYIY